MAIPPLREIYLDNNATTPALKEAVLAAKNAMESMYGNPSSTHVTGLRARYILESTRDLAKAVLGVGRGNIIFLSGATEGIQTAIFSTLNEVKQKIKLEGKNNYQYLLYGATEHKAVPNSLKHWNDILEVGAELKSIPVDENGKLNYSFIKKYIGRAAMICTMAVNNETGVIQNLAELDVLIRSINPHVAWMADCVQALGKISLALADTSIDYAAFSGHKLYAPKGIGMLYVNEKAPLTPFIAGGGQEKGLRSGTENLPGVAALGAVLKLLNDPDDKVFKSHDVLQSYRDTMVKTLKRAFPSIVFNMPFETSVPTTINFSVKDFLSKEILDLFDAAQIRVSSGSACSSGVTRSYVLDEMGVEPWQSESAIRMSFGPAVSSQEINAACKRILLASQALTQSCLLLNNLDVDVKSSVSDGLIQLKSGSKCTWLYADSESKSIIVIDPVEELGERIETFVKCQNYQVKGILDTHSHADHESCRPILQKLLESQMSHALHEYDNLGWPTDDTKLITLSSGQEVPAIALSGGRVLVCLTTPGHTKDSQMFLIGKAHGDKLNRESVRFAFAGDTILIGGLGRTNFCSSSTSELYDTLQTVNSVVGRNALLCPAHDYNTEFVTTINAELLNNQLFHRVIIHELSKNAFIQQKEKLDLNLENAIGHEVICGVVENPYDSEGLHIEPEDLKLFLKEHPHIRLLDVREAYEYRLFNCWENLNLEHSPENVPLSRLANFIGDNMQRENCYQEELLFVCRSGSRSGKVAATFRRLGFEKACHITGGVALNSKEVGV